ncbi:alpha/beta-hydrolase [Trametes cingulata]|nr:alpha/beta-hydrolase [Trametes cingulata]
MSPVATIKTVCSSDGSMLHAEGLGNPRNPHVVFIHEVTLSSAVFDELARDKRLTDHLYIVRYDLRCHGRSSSVSGDEGHHQTCYANDFNAVVRAFGLRRPVVVAWGLGAAVVTDVCASTNPIPISGAVFVSPLPFLGSEMPRAATERMLRMTQILRSSQDTVISARAKTELVNALFSGAARPVPDAIRAAWLGVSMSQPPDVTRAVLSRQHDASKLLEIGRQGFPLMILAGSNDALVNSTAVVAELRRHFREAEVHVVEGGSHALFVDKKDEFVKLLLVFVGRLAVMTLMG